MDFSYFQSCGSVLAIRDVCGTKIAICRQFHEWFLEANNSFDGIGHDFCFACLDDIANSCTMTTISTRTIYVFMTIYDHEDAVGGTLLSPLLRSPCRCRPHQLLLPLVVVLAIQACRSCVLMSLHESQSLALWFQVKDWDPFSKYHNRLQRLSCKMLQVLRCF